MRGAVIVVFMAAGLAARAEVRLEESGGTAYDVVIEPTNRGPWTPTGQVTTMILNPSGDLNGDSLPGWDGTDTVLAAWVRPGTATIEKSIGTVVGWEPTMGWNAPGAIGQPVVNQVPGGFGVIWQVQDATGLHVVAGGVGLNGGEDFPDVVADGHLVGTWVLNGELYVITSDPTDRVLQLTLVTFAFVPTQPIPIQSTLLDPMVGDLGQIGVRDADVRLHEIEANDEDLLVLTWWTGATTLNWVRVDADGSSPTGSLTARSGWHPERLVTAALRDATRHR